MNPWSKIMEETEKIADELLDQDLEVEEFILLEGVDKVDTILYARDERLAPDKLMFPDRVSLYVKHCKNSNLRFAISDKDKVEQAVDSLDGEWEGRKISSPGRDEARCEGHLKVKHRSWTTPESRFKSSGILEVTNLESAKQSCDQILVLGSGGFVGRPSRRI